MPTVDILSPAGEKAGSVDLPDDVEDVVRKVNRAGFLAGGAENVNGRHKSDSLGSSAHQDDAAAGPGYGALDQQQTLVGIHRVDREVLGGLATVSYTHLTLPTDLT